MLRHGIVDQNCWYRGTGVGITLGEPFPETLDPSVDFSIASDPKSTLSSKFGTLAVISSLSPSLTDATPMNGQNSGMSPSVTIRIITQLRFLCGDSHARLCEE